MMMMMMHKIGRTAPLEYALVYADTKFNATSPFLTLLAIRKCYWM